MARIPPGAGWTRVPGPGRCCVLGARQAVAPWRVRSWQAGHLPADLGVRGVWRRPSRRVAEGPPRQASRVGRRRPFGIALPHLGASGRPEEPGGGRAPHRREALVPGPCRVWGGGGHRDAAPSSPGRRAAAPRSAPSGRTDPSVVSGPAPRGCWFTEGGTGLGPTASRAASSERPCDPRETAGDGPGGGRQASAELASSLVPGDEGTGQ